MDVRRVVQLWVKDPNRPDRIGSGYLLNDSTVLTATHVLGPMILGREVAVLAPGDVLVQSHFAGQTVPASRVLRLPGDIALLIVDRPFVHPLGPIPIRGTLGSKALVLPAVVVGYPELELQQRPMELKDPEHLTLMGTETYRRDRQLDGEISSATGFTDGTLTVHLAPRHFPLVGERQPGHSVFMGLSGAAIFIGGYLVGVITEDPRPDHPTVLLGQRLDRVALHLHGLAALSGSISGQNCEPLYGAAVDVSQTAGALAVRQAHLWQALTILEKIPGGELKDRGQELLQLAKFCADPSAGYMVWHAHEWSGKSALLATFVAEPPAGTDIVAFFIDRNDGEARTADRYLASMINQLEAYLDGPNEAANLAVPGAAAGRYRDLLTRAAATARYGGRQFVLVVDGLDEDEAFAPNSVSTTSISELLPMHTDGLHVIVATRPYEHVLTAVPAHHPFRTTTPVTLSTSPHAADVRDEAAREVRKAATGTDATAQSILAFLYVAGEEMTPAELAELTGHLLGNDSTVTVTAIRTRLQTGLHRAVWQRVGAANVTRDSAAETNTEAYGWAHATLPQMVMKEFGTTLINRHAEALHEWAEEHRRRGWSDDTPHYLETGYPRLLASAARSEQLTAYALDRTRRDWLLSRRGGYDQTLKEIVQAGRLLAVTRPHNVGMLVLLAFERDRLQERYKQLPDGVPAVWAMIGNTNRAEVLAHSMPIERQGPALEQVVSVLGAAGNVDEAERLAHTIPDKRDRDYAVAQLVNAQLDAGNLDKAQRIADTIPDERQRSLALARVVGALSDGSHLDEVERIVRTITEGDLQRSALTPTLRALAIAGNTEELKRVAGTIKDEHQLVGTLADVASALVEAGRTKDAELIAGDAERIASTILDEHHRMEALADVVSAQATLGHMRDAERIAGTITDEYYRARALTEVSYALAIAGNADGTERIVRTITDTVTDEYTRASALGDLASALAANGNTDEATRIADTIAATVANEYSRGSALCGVAYGFARAGIISEIERIVRAIPKGIGAAAQEQIVSILAIAGNADEAERFADTLTERDRRANALIELARALGSAGDTDGVQRMAHKTERIANAIKHKDTKAKVLAELARFLAVAGLSNEAERIFHEAERIANTVKDENDRADTFTELAHALAATGRSSEAERLVREAEGIASTISDASRRNRALSELARALAATGNSAEAERIARAFKAEDLRTKTLTEVANALAIIGHSGEAERIADTITDEYSRAKALAQVAFTLANAGNTVDALPIAGIVERIAGTSRSENRWGFLLAGVAFVLVRAHRLDDAERIAGFITDEYHQAWTLAQVARALADAGFRGKAALLVREAERFAGTIADEHDRVMGLSQVAQIVANTGLNDDVARILGEAERIADTVTGEQFRVDRLAEVATVWAAVSHSDDATRILRTAESIAGILKDGYFRWRGLFQVARAYAVAGSSDEAKRIVATIANERWRADGLAEIACALAVAGNTKEAKQLADEAERIAGAITDEYERGEVLIKIARAQGVAGDGIEAERVACQVLLTAAWPLALRALLDDGLAEAAVKPVEGWLTSTLITELINGE
ncbi:hypothetical protein AB0N71_18045 [Pseudarthrobacter enclensis]|uniref:hypothetical protein n=1 Tax=Pseudarthrobacter enclensis TaxID=993070 RepID=UPI00341E383A